MGYAVIGMDVCTGVHGCRARTVWKADHSSASSEVLTCAMVE